MYKSVPIVKSENTRYPGTRIQDQSILPMVVAATFYIKYNILCNYRLKTKVSHCSIQPDGHDWGTQPENNNVFEYQASYIPDVPKNLRLQFQSYSFMRL